MNAKTVEDVRFFYSLWINLNDINNFIETAIWIIFSIIVLLEILVLVIFLFKFLFTKKEFKKKRIARWIISFFILIITFITVSSWMYIDKKIKALPNWQELAYWNIQILNNDLLKKSDKFNREAALITETTNLIWPMNIKFDLTNFAKNEKEKWIKINKYKWNFWWESEITTLEPTIIKKFNEKWAYKVTLTLEEVDLHWDIVEKVVENIPSIEIAYLVEVEEEKLDNWGKIVKFDASDLKDLWKIDWYFITDDNTDLKPVFTWYKFNPAKVIFEDTIIWFQIQKEDRKNDNLDKIFIVEAVKQNDIKGKIEIQQDPLDDLLYTFSVKDINSDFGNWFIEEFKWKIDNVKTKTLQSDIDNIEKSSTFKIKFKKYWKHIIKVDLKDSNWNIKTIEKEFEIKKNIKLKKILEFYNDNRPLENIEYKKSTHEYFIKNLKVPTILEINAKNIESDNILDYLEKIQWDIWWDGDIDEEWKVLNYEIPKWWSYQIDVIYTFQNKRIKSQKTILKESIYIDSEKKEVLLDLKIKKTRDYVPIRVSFDASSSYVKWKDIAKFIFDYWDGTAPDVRDAKNPWHRYIKPGDYTVKLTVVTTDWKEYSIEKKLVLKPQPQEAKITASMKTAPIYTSIDFSSTKSSWEIIGYFWDFGDWETSTDANPSHMYKNPWNYKVVLTLDYKNKNTLSDEIELKITDE
jgi:PKD repeat protein